MSKPMSMAERRRLWAQHTCVRDASSINCRACDEGVLYPPAGETLDEVLDSLFPRVLEIARKER